MQYDYMSSNTRRQVNIKMSGGRITAQRSEDDRQADVAFESEYRVVANRPEESTLPACEGAEGRVICTSAMDARWGGHDEARRSGSAHAAAHRGPRNRAGTERAGRALLGRRPVPGRALRHQVWLLHDHHLLGCDLVAALQARQVNTATKALAIE